MRIIKNISACILLTLSAFPWISAHAALLNGVDWPTAPGVYVLLEGDTKPVHIDTIVSQEASLHSQATIAEKIVLLTQKTAIKQINFANDLSVLNGSAVNFRVLVANEQSGDGTTHGHLGQSYQCSSSYWRDVDPSFAGESYCIIDFGSTPIALYNESGAAYEIMLKFFRQVHDEAIPGLLREEEPMSPHSYTFISNQSPLDVFDHNLDADSVTFSIKNSPLNSTNSACAESKTDCFDIKKKYKSCAGRDGWTLETDKTNDTCNYFADGVFNLTTKAIYSSSVEYTSPYIYTNTTDALNAGRADYPNEQCTQSGDIIFEYIIGTKGECVAWEDREVAGTIMQVCTKTYNAYHVSQKWERECSLPAPDAVPMETLWDAEPKPGSSALQYLDLDRAVKNTYLKASDVRSKDLIPLTGPSAIYKSGAIFLDPYSIENPVSKDMEYTAYDFFGNSTTYIVESAISPGPLVAIDIEEGAELPGLSTFTFTAKDDADAARPVFVMAVKIVGQNIKQPVDLTANYAGVNYEVDLPMQLLPSIGADDAYQVEVVASDIYGNVTRETRNFRIAVPDNYDPDAPYLPQTPVAVNAMYSGAMTLRELIDPVFIESDQYAYVVGVEPIFDIDPACSIFIFSAEEIVDFNEGIQCLLTWTRVPEGLEFDPVSKKFVGAVPGLGDRTFEYRVDAISGSVYDRVNLFGDSKLITFHNPPPPEFGEIFTNLILENSPKTPLDIEIPGLGTLTVPPNSVAIEVNPGLENALDPTLWGPDKVNLQFIQTDAAQNALSELGQFSYWPDKQTILGNKQFYFFNIPDEHLLEGSFRPLSYLHDKYGNSNNREFDSRLIDRKAPRLSAFWSVDESRFEPLSDQNIYFLEHLRFKLTDGTDDAPILNGLSLDGQSVPYVQTPEGFAISSAFADTVANNQVLDLIAHTSDKTGNVGYGKIRARYRTDRFDVKGLSESVVEEVVPLSGVIRRTSHCSFDGMENTPLLCNFKPRSIPLGMTYDVGSNVELSGIVSSENERFNLGYDIEAIDFSGRRAVVYQNDIERDVMPPSAPRIVIGRSDINNGETVYYQKSSFHRNPLRISMKGYPSDFVVSIKNKSTNEEIFRDEVFRSDSGYIAFPEQPLYQPQTYVVETSYAMDPENVFSFEFDYVEQPTNRMALDIVADPENIVASGATYSLTVKFGEIQNRNSTTVYDRATHGDWVVYLTKSGSNGHEFLTPATQILDDGTASFEIGEFPEGQIKYRAVAELVPDAGSTLSRTVKSPYAYLYMVDLAAPDVEVSRLEIIGKAPFYASVWIRPSTNEVAQALGEVTWGLASDPSATDQSQFDFSQFAEFDNRLNLKTLVDQSKEFALMAKVSNSLDNTLTSVTPPIYVRGYFRPKIGLTEASNIFVGDTFTIDFFDKTLAAEGLRLFYSLDQGETWLEGNAVQLTPAVAGPIRLMVKGRYDQENEQDEFVWGEVDKTLFAYTPTAPDISLRLPEFTVPLNSYELYARSRNTLSVPYPVRGYWTMPDGSTVENPISEFTPEAALDYPVSYTYWYEGFESQTTATQQATIRTWDYRWPHWYTVLNQVDRIAPAEMSVGLKHSRIPISITPITNWQLSHGLENLASDERSIKVAANDPGVYVVQARISDEKGNSSDVQQFIQVFEPLPFSLRLRTYSSTLNWRYPTDVSAYLDIWGGRDDDQIQSIDWTVNGNQIPEEELMGGRYAFLTGLPIGQHQVEISVNTSIAGTFSRTYMFEIFENSVPVCSPTSTVEPDGSVLYFANCYDSDGYVTAYEWTLDGVKITHLGNKMLVKPEEVGLPISVKSEDNAGAWTSEIQL